MEGLHGLLISTVTNFGVPGIIFVIWYFSEKSHERTLLAYREDTVQNMAAHQQHLAEMRRQYEQGMSEIRTMYENNVDLVKRYASMASDLKELVVHNTQVMTKLCEEVCSNQYCPLQRNDKPKREAPAWQRSE